MLRNWSGVWEGMITFLALAHMQDAMQLVWGGGRMITFLALAHMLDATQLVWGVGGDDKNRGNNVLNPRIWDCGLSVNKDL